MKTKQLPTLIILAVALLLMGVAFMARRDSAIETTSQAQTLSDWAYGSSGTLKVMATYPTELLTNQNNMITLTFEPDETLEQNLASGYIFDAQFNANSSVITPQRRILTPLEKGRQTISWEIVPFGKFDINGVLEMALGGSGLSGTYAISPQVSLEIPFEVRQSNGLNPQNSFIIGLVMVVVALFLLLFSIFNKKPLGQRAK